MPAYELLVDGERKHRARDDADARRWIAEYREEHAETDPDAVHVQVLEVGRLTWLTGGKLVPREHFL
jgi:phenylpyruvate tautomerase PptA (4-oxalocrotonate tautomerase family)